METKIRAFLSVSLDDVIKNTINNFIENELISFTNIHWTKKENLHFTLQFFGNITEDIITSLFDVLTDVALSYQPFDIKLHSVGAFPNLQKPSIILIGINDEKKLFQSLGETLKRKLNDFPIKKESKEFLPHLTIGRVKVLKNIPALSNKIKEIENSNFKCSGNIICKTCEYKMLCNA